MAELVDERAIEHELKTMVVRVEKTSDRTASLGCLVSIGGIVGGGYFAGWKGAGLGFVGIFLVFGAAAWWDDFAIRRSVKRFQALYPAGSRAREVALQVLSELESEAKALEKLRKAIRGADGDSELVRRRRAQPTVEQQLGAPLPTAPVAAPPLPAEPARPVPKTPNLIPLEPFEPEPQPNAEERDERDPGARGRD